MRSDRERAEILAGWQLYSRLMAELAFEDDERRLDLEELDSLYPKSERVTICAGLDDAEE